MYYFFLLTLIYITTSKLSNTLLVLNYTGFFNNNAQKNNAYMPKYNMKQNKNNCEDEHENIHITI